MRSREGELAVVLTSVCSLCGSAVWQSAYRRQGVFRRRHMLLRVAHAHAQILVTAVFDASRAAGRCARAKTKRMHVARAHVSHTEQRRRFAYPQLPLARSVSCAHRLGLTRRDTGVCGLLLALFPVLFPALFLALFHR